MSEKSRNQTVVFILLFITVNLAVFLPAMKGNFIWDDHYFVASNPLITSPRFLPSFLTSPYGGFSGADENSRSLDKSIQFYRPLTSLSFWLDYKVWGMNPAAFHLTNIVLHTANVILLYFILSAVGFAGLPAFFGGLLFSVFPAHFENVAWISGRTDLVSFLFGALSALLFLRFLKKRRTSALVFSSLFFLLSLLAKESSLLLFGVYLLVLIWRKEKIRQVALSMIPFGAAAAAWFLMRQSVFSWSAPQASGRGLADVLAVSGFYGFRMIFPFRLSVTVDALPVFRNPFFIAGGAVMILAFGIALAVLALSEGKRPSAPVAHLWRVRPSLDSCRRRHHARRSRVARGLALYVFPVGDLLWGGRAVAVAFGPQEMGRRGPDGPPGSRLYGRSLSEGAALRTQ